MKVTTKRLLPALLVIVLIGFGVGYQNCGQLESGSDNGSNNPSGIVDTSAEGKAVNSNKTTQDQLEVLLADGTKIYMVREQKRDPLIVTLKDGTELHLTPSDKR